MSFLRKSSPSIFPILNLVFAAISLWCSAYAASAAGTVSVAWNRNVETNISGYKIYWGETPRQYIKVLDAGNSIEAALTNLTAGQVYFCAVTAYNTDGQESPYSAEVSLSYIPQQAASDTSSRLVFLEAEDGQLGAPMAVFAEGGTSYVATSSYSTTAWVQGSFSVGVADDYHVWCRVRAGTASTDSFGVTVNNAPEEIFHVYGSPDAADGIRDSGWIWKKIHQPSAGPRIYTLAAGSHSIRFRSREPGAHLDRIVLTSDPNLVPTDSLPRSGDVLAVVGNPVSVVRDAGQAAYFTVAAAATGPVSYQWKKDGIPIPGATSSMLVITPLTTSHAGAYTVDLAHGTVSKNAGPASLIVNAVGTGTIFRVRNMTVNSDRSIAFQIEGELDSNIVIYASSDLKVWSPISTQMNLTGEITVSDPGGSNKKQRFYRLESGSASPF